MNFKCENSKVCIYFYLDYWVDVNNDIIIPMLPRAFILLFLFYFYSIRKKIDKIVISLIPAFLYYYLYCS